MSESSSFSRQDGLIAKAFFVAVVWFVGLYFLGGTIGITALFSGTAAAAWLIGQRWVAPAASLTLLVAMAVHFTIAPPPSEWRNGAAFLKGYVLSHDLTAADHQTP